MATKLFAPTLSALFLVLLMVGFRYGPALFEESWLKAARALHTEWAETARIGEGDVLNARNYLSGLRRLDPAPHLPDLTGAGLDIGQVTYIAKSQDRPQGIHVGYIDRARCRISLWIAPSRQAGDDELENHDNRTVSWRTGGLRYVLVTSDMEYDRFHLIAKTARQSTLARRGPGETEHAALGFSAMISRPCSP